jgi:hypothetical protein
MLVNRVPAFILGFNSFLQVNSETTSPISTGCQSGHFFVSTLFYLVWIALPFNASVLEFLMQKAEFSNYRIVVGPA